MSRASYEAETFNEDAISAAEDRAWAKAKAARLRKDAKLLDTGMDPDLVRELHAEADALDPRS